MEAFDATRENVLAHEQVNEAVMREHTVIPMSFGTVFKTRGISGQRGSAYLRAHAVRARGEAALETRSERYVSEIFEQLRPVSVPAQEAE